MRSIVIIFAATIVSVFLALFIYNISTLYVKAFRITHTHTRTEE